MQFKQSWPILMIKTVHIVDLIEKFNTVKNHVDRIQINSLSISIDIKINRYLTHLLSYKTVLNEY